MAPGDYHLVVDVWIRNRNGKYLISKRAPNKPLPNIWETTSGSAITGDDSLAAAIREAKEEVGVNLDRSRGRVILRQVRPGAGSSTILDVWLFDEKIGDVEPTCQVDEVSEARWATKAEIVEMIASGLFVSHIGPELALLE